MGQPEIMAVLPDLGGGGAQRVTITLLNGLSSRGRGVKLMAFDAGGPLAELCDPTIPVWTAGRGRLRTAILPLIGEIRRCKPRVVLSTLGYVNLGLLLLRPLLPATTRLWVREANLPSLSLSNNRFPSLMRTAYRTLYPTAERVVCTSRRMSEEMERDFGVPSHVLCELHNPVDVSAIRIKARPLRRSPGVGRRFAAAGRLTAQKGFDRLLGMFAESANPEDRLTILGEGPLLDELRRRTTELGVGEQVNFPGFLDMPWSWYAGADAFLLPSRWEGMPNAALEALACGVPVIATPESGGIAEVAALARPGTVTMARAGQDFSAAMRAVVPSNVAELRDSLLPIEFSLDYVLDRVVCWLDDAG